MRQIVLYQDESGAWIADVPSLPGCHSDGKTPEEAVERVKEAIDLWIEVAQEDGLSIPDDKHTARIIELESEFIALLKD